MQREAQAEDDQHSRRGNIRAFKGLMSGGPQLMSRLQRRPYAYREAPLAHMPHEGSFYPMRLLRHFVRVLNASEFATSRLLASAVRTGSSFSSSMGKGSLLLEETLLPTFVWQHYKSLAAAASASPPVVSRTWPVGRAVSLGGLARLVNAMNQSAYQAAHGYLCGIKLPRGTARGTQLSVGLVGDRTHDLLRVMEAAPEARRRWIELNSTFDASEASPGRRCRAYDDDEESKSGCLKTPWSLWDWCVCVLPGRLRYVPLPGLMAFKIGRAHV